MSSPLCQPLICTSASSSSLTDHITRRGTGTMSSKSIVTPTAPGFFAAWSQSARCGEVTRIER